MGTAGNYETVLPLIKKEAAACLAKMPKGYTGFDDLCQEGNMVFIHVSRSKGNMDKGNFAGYLKSSLRNRFNRLVEKAYKHVKIEAKDLKQVLSTKNLSLSFFDSILSLNSQEKRYLVEALAISSKDRSLRRVACHKLGMSAAKEALTLKKIKMLFC